MNIVGNFGTVASPKHQASEFLMYEDECREVLRPLLDGIIEVAEKAGWQRRTVASALMFLAAKHVSATAGASATA
jgi:hypothetical protein